MARAHPSPRAEHLFYPHREFVTGPTTVTILCSKEVGHYDRDLGKHCQKDKYGMEDVVRHVMAVVTFLEERELSFVGHDEHIELSQKNFLGRPYHETDWGNRAAPRKACPCG